MTARCLRPRDDLDAQLGEESRIAGEHRSEIARLAIAEFHAKREKAEAL